MILFIEVLIIIILVMIFSTLIIDQRKNRVKEMHLVRLKGYWSGSERRTVDRLNTILEVRYSVNGKPVEVKSVDISTKGIRLLLDEKFEKGTPLRLAIKLPDQDQLIRANGAVVWAEESLEDEKNSEKRLFNTGIKFNRLGIDAEKRLFDFIYRVQPKSA